MQNLYNRNSFDAGLPKCAEASPNRPRKTNTFRSGPSSSAAILPSVVVPRAVEYRTQKVN